MAYTRYTSSPAQMISMMIGSALIEPQRTRSQKYTYASEITKNRIVTARKIASCIVHTFPFGDSLVVVEFGSRVRRG